MEPTGASEANREYILTSQNMCCKPGYERLSQGANTKPSSTIQPLQMARSPGRSSMPSQPAAWDALRLPTQALRWAWPICTIFSLPLTPLLITASSQRVSSRASILDSLCPQEKKNMPGGRSKSLEKAVADVEYPHHWPNIVPHSFLLSGWFV